MATIKFISPEALEARFIRNSRFVLVDVRTPADYRAAHIPRSLLVPLESLTPSLLRDLAGPDFGEMILICRTGKRAQKAATRLASHIDGDLAIVDGGVLAWEAAGLPVVRRRRTFPIEHRVRTAAGSLVLLGTLLGLLIHPVFLAIPVLIGVALVIAGLADTLDPGYRLARRRQQAGS